MRLISVVNRLVVLLLGVMLLVGIGCCVGGIHFLLDGEIPEGMGKDTVTEFCDGKFEIIQLYNPKRRVLIEAKTSKTVADGVTEYHREGEVVLVHTADEVVTINCGTAAVGRAKKARE